MKRFLRGATAAVVALVVAGGEARPQAVADLPAVRDAPARDSFVLEWLEAPAEIALGTMAVNVWASVSRSGSDPLGLVTLVWSHGEGGEERIEMHPIDGALDSPREQLVATVDTYGWTQGGRREFEVRVEDAGSLTRIGGGAVTVKSRISTPDLFLFDDRGVAHPWLGSGAGGFTSAEILSTGPPSGPLLADVNADGLSDLVLSGGFGEVFFYQNRGAGRFEAGRSILVSGEIVATVIGDLNGDRQPDLVTAASDRTLEIRLGLADEATQTSQLSLAPDLLEVADVDGDGRPEIVVALLGLQAGEVQIWPRTGAKSTSWAPTIRLVAPSGIRGRVRDLAWVGPDGPLCILSSSFGDAALESWGPAADTKPGSEPVLLGTTSMPGEPLALLPGRFGREGATTCLFVVRESETTTVFEYRGREVVRRLEIDGSDPVAFAALDLDADGDDDLVTGGEELRIWINLQAGSFREAGESPYLLDSRVAALVAGSLDERGP